MCTLLQLDALPADLKEKIAGMLGPPHTADLRSCSWQWKTACTNSMTSASFPAEQLTAAMPLLNRLPKLQRVFVKGRTFPATGISGNALSPLRAQLNALSLTSEECSKPGGSFDVSLAPASYVQAYGMDATSDGEEEQEKQYKVNQRPCTLIVENLGELLQPWHQTLEYLYLSHCSVAGWNHSVQDDSGFFAKFPNLCILHLVSLRANSSGTTGLATLDLSGCKALEVLSCTGSGVRALNL